MFVSYIGSQHAALHRAPSPPPGFAHALLPSNHRSPTLRNGPSEGLEIGEDSGHPLEESSQERGQYQVSISMLPGNALLGIFNLCLNDWHAKRYDWYTLIHVCQRWRRLVFASRHPLDLQLEYTGNKPVTEMPDTLLRLPMVIEQGRWDDNSPTSRASNIVSLLDSGHRDRVCELNLINVPSSLWERIAAVMQKPFLELTDVTVWVADNGAPVLPSSFLGASAPHLRGLSLERIPVLLMQNPLFFASDLVRLSLLDIPDSGYISPKAMFTCLSEMTHLEELALGFQSPRFRPDRAGRLPPPLTRSVLPALISFTFQGVCEYLEDLVAQFDAPLLRYLNIHFFMNIFFNAPQLHRFISGARELKNSDGATVLFSQYSILFVVAPTTESNKHTSLELVISSRQSDWQLSSLAQACRSSLPPFSTLDSLRVMYDAHFHPHWNDDVDNNQWLELLDPFISVKDLYLSKEIALRVGHALNDIDEERVTEVLPALHCLFLEGLQSSGRDQELMGGFVAARQLSGQPVVVGDWEKDGNE